MKILFVASELTPIAKVGGLGDVVAALPKALKPLGIDVSVALPFYEMIKIKKEKLKLVQKNVPVIFENKKQSFNLWQTYLLKSKVPLFLIENKKYFSGEDVYAEDDASSGGSESEAARFLFLSIAAIKIAKITKTNILHCHDWHTAIIPYLLKRERSDIKTLLTIHNLAYQGRYSSKIVNKLLGTKFSSEKINCVRLGILNADFINTVSPSYAKEILTPKFGFELQKYLRKRKKDLTGIVNGLDFDLFDPETDKFLKTRYSLKTLRKKNDNKIYLQKKYFKKINPKIPILGIISRLADQKGMDLIQGIFKKLMKKDIQFILLGKGVKRYEKFFEEASEKFSEKFSAKIGFDEELAHQIYAGIDIFLMPSYFEPCGLGQQIAMKYGTIPVAKAVGGIKDTVFPVKIVKGKVKGNGFLFNKYRENDFFKSIKEALKLYEKKDIWKKIQLNAMKQDFSWKNSAKKYKSLYEIILKK